MWVFDPEHTARLFFKKEAAKKILSDKLIEMYDLTDVEDSDLYFLELSQLNEVCNDFKWMEPEELIEFYELPNELLDIIESESCWADG